MKSQVTDWLNNHVSSESYEFAMSDVQGDMSDNDFVLSETKDGLWDETVQILGQIWHSKSNHSIGRQC